MPHLGLKSSGILGALLLFSCSPPEFNSSTRGPSGPKAKSSGEQVGAAGQQTQSSGNGEGVAGTNAATSSAGGGGAGGVGIPKEISDCATKSLLSKDLVLDFPATKGQCKWDIGEDA